MRKLMEMTRWNSITEFLGRARWSRAGRGLSLSVTVHRGSGRVGSGLSTW